MIVPTPQGPSLYATKEGLEHQAAEKMYKRFPLARSTPICTDKELHEDCVFLEDTKATRQVQEGTCVSPPGTDPYTKMLLEEAHHLFSKMTVEEVSVYIRTEDVQDFGDAPTRIFNHWSRG